MELEKAVQTQISNIQTKTGKSFEELSAIIRGCGLTKHGEIRSMLMETLGLGHGDANTLVHIALKTDGASQAAGKADDDVLTEIYSGPKENLRPIHDALMEHINGFGDFEISPKKGYVSLRRKKQFAMIGPATNTRVEVGINMKGVPGSDRLLEQPAGSMCQYKVKVTEANEVDGELVGWVKQAYDAAG